VAWAAVDGERHGQRSSVNGAGSGKIGV